MAFPPDFTPEFDPVDGQCMALYNQYKVLRAAGDYMGALEHFYVAQSLGCSWTSTVNTATFPVQSDQQEDGGPDLTVPRPGTRWPPCPTPWNPGHKWLRFSLAGALYGEVVLDP